MKTKQLTHEQEAAKMVGFIINLVLTLAGGAFCVYGIALFLSPICGATFQTENSNILKIKLP